MNICTYKRFLNITCFLIKKTQKSQSYSFFMNKFATCKFIFLKSMIPIHSLFWKNVLVPVYYVLQYDPRSFDLSSRGQLTKNFHPAIFRFSPTQKTNKSQPYSCASSNIDPLYCSCCSSFVDVVYIKLSKQGEPFRFVNFKISPPAKF
jgi:hypothetical protein